MGHFELDSAESNFAVTQSSRNAKISFVFGLLAFVTGLIGGVIAIIFGLMALREIDRTQGEIRGRGLAIAGIALGGVGTVLSILLALTLLFPLIKQMREAARRDLTRNNLRQIGLAIHNYHDANKLFPPQGVLYPDPQFRNDHRSNAEPKPKLGLSWCVRILPYIWHAALYKQFDWNQPWEHPTNRALLHSMPDVYVSPNRPMNDGKTVYLGVTYPVNFDFTMVSNQEIASFLAGTIFDNHPSRRVGLSAVGERHVPDGTTNTIAVLEANADMAVDWIKPDDWELDLMNPHHGLGTLRPGGFMALFADGSIRFIAMTIDDRNLLRMFCRNDREQIELPKAK